MIQNILGKGMDCHLLALKRISEENGLGTPELFKDETYSISNKFALSTSQVNFLILF
jgi:choline O-acetyltransferase